MTGGWPLRRKKVAQSLASVLAPSEASNTAYGTASPDCKYAVYALLVLIELYLQSKKIAVEDEARRG